MAGEGAWLQQGGRAEGACTSHAAAVEKGRDRSCWWQCGSLDRGLVLLTWQWQWGGECWHEGGTGTRGNSSGGCTQQGSCGACVAIATYSLHGLVQGPMTCVALSCSAVRQPWFATTPRSCCTAWSPLQNYIHPHILIDGRSLKGVMYNWGPPTACLGQLYESFMTDDLDFCLLRLHFWTWPSLFKAI